MTTNVHFRVYCETTYGQTVHVLGDVAALGGWMPTENNKLKWIGLGWWETSAPGLNLPKQRIQYKFAIKDQLGGLQWEAGENRQFENQNNCKIVEAFDRRKEAYNYPESLPVKVNIIAVIILQFIKLKLII